MVCYTGKSNQLKPLGDISGERLSCIAALSGFLFGDSIVNRIPLTRGKFAIVDTADYDYLMQWKWYVRPEKNTFYAARKVCFVSKGKKRRKTVFMHRDILNTPKGLQSDHVNHNGLDNRRCNLRICTHSGNCQNQLPLRNCASPYKGVRRNGKRWQASIFHNHKGIYIGTYDTELEAAKAYDAKAKELFGEFACTNAECGNQYAIEFMTEGIEE